MKKSEKFYQNVQTKFKKTRQSKQCGFSIYIFDNSKSKSMVRLVRAEKMVLSGLVFSRKIARMILIPNIGFNLSPYDSHGIYALIYVRNVRCYACTHTDTQTVESRAVFCLSRIRNFDSPTFSELREGFLLITWPLTFILINKYQDLFASYLQIDKQKSKQCGLSPQS